MSWSLEHLRAGRAGLARAQGEHSWRCCRLAPGTAGRSLCLSTPSRAAPLPVLSAGIAGSPCQRQGRRLRARCCRLGTARPAGRRLRTHQRGLGDRGQARGQAPRSRWHCARSRRRGSRAPALFGREKARTGALCVSRSHARLETRPRAQTVNARVRKRGKRGVGMAGNGQEEEQGSSPTDRQTDLQDHVPADCRGLCSTLTFCSIATLAAWEIKSSPAPLPSTAQRGSCCLPGSVQGARPQLLWLFSLPGAQQALSSRQPQAIKLRCDTRSHQGRGTAATLPPPLQGHVSLCLAGAGRPLCPHVGLERPG